jgi:hypothetical protein
MVGAGTDPAAHVTGGKLQSIDGPQEGREGRPKPRPARAG